MAQTQFTETEALLIALEHGESNELHDYLLANFLPGELIKLQRACRALAWTANAAEAEMRRAEGSP